MYAARRWSVRNAALLERVYALFERVLARIAPAIGAKRLAKLEPAVVAVEKRVKGLLFDCQMCGRCVLSSTGLSCPMNCPKQLRNGPCGGVRGDGMCEVKPDMRCVWVEAFEGSRRQRDGSGIMHVQFAVDHSRRGRSAWVARATELAEEVEAARAGPRPAAKPMSANAEQQEAA